MKKIILFFGILALSTSIFTSCNEDEEENQKKDEPQVSNQRRLVSSTFKTAGIYNMETHERDTIRVNANYEYDSEGRVIKVYDINDYQENYDYNGLVKTFFKGGVETAKGELNVEGSIVSDSAYDGSYKRNYFYDESGYLKKYNSMFVVDENNSSLCYCSYTWQDGNIVSCVVRYGGTNNGAAMELDVSDHVYVYTNETVSTPIENKSGLLFLFDNGLDFSFAYGKKCKNLPVVVNNQKIEWTLDDEGYPVKVVANNITMTFTWK